MAAAGVILGWFEPFENRDDYQKNCASQCFGKGVLCVKTVAVAAENSGGVFGVGPLCLVVVSNEVIKVGAVNGAAYPGGFWAGFTKEGVVIVGFGAADFDSLFGVDVDLSSAAGQQLVEVEGCFNVVVAVKA